MRAETIGKGGVLVAPAFRLPSRRCALALSLIFLTIAAVLAPVVLSLPIGIFDEGFVVSGAMLIPRGGLPIRDFYVIYGPGQYYLTAGAFALFGEDLLVSRAVHVVLLAMLGATIAGCAAMLAPRTRVLPVAVTLVFLIAAGILPLNPGYASLPAVLLLLGGCLIYSHSVPTKSLTSLLAASSLVGVAGVFRWDFCIFGLLAMCLTMGTVMVARRTTEGLDIRTMAAAFLPAPTVMLIAFTPSLISGGAARWFEEVPLFLLREFQTWRNLEFVRPAIWQVASAWLAKDLMSLSSAIARLVYAAVAPCAALAAFMIAVRRIRGSRGPVASADALALVLSLLTLLLLNQMRVRSGFPQGFPALAASLPLVAYVLIAIPVRISTQRGALAVLGGALAVVLIVIPSYVMQYRVRVAATAFFDRPAEVPRAQVMRSNRSPEAKAESDEYADLIRHIRTSTRGDEFILSAVADMSRLFVNDAMLYFLADRLPATRWIEMEPGLTNTEKGQRELIEALESRNVRTIILRTLTSHEPNATSRSNGVHLFDEYVRRGFVGSRRFGAYEVLVRRGT